MSNPPPSTSLPSLGVSTRRGTEVRRSMRSGEAGSSYSYLADLPNSVQLPLLAHGHVSEPRCEVSNGAFGGLKSLEAMTLFSQRLARFVPHTGLLDGGGGLHQLLTTTRV